MIETMENDGYNVSGKNVFVTGTSKGLGEQVGLRLLDLGAHVIGSSRSVPPDSWADSIAGGEADYEIGDLSDDWDRIVENIYEKHSGYEIYINNAGALSPDYFTLLEPSIIEREIKLDLIVPLLLHRQWFGLYNQRPSESRVPELSVNICSISSFYAWAGGTAYQAAKSGLSAALAGLRSMENYIENHASVEEKSKLGATADLKTRLVSIYPDNVDTGLLSRTQQDSLYRVKGDLLPSSVVTDVVIQAVQGVGKFGEYDDIAILANPNDPKTKRELKGIFLAFLPLDDETSRPNFGARILEQIGDEDMLIRGKK